MRGQRSNCLVRYCWSYHLILISTVVWRRLPWLSERVSFGEWKWRIESGLGAHSWDDSFIDKGINETFESAHTGHTNSSLIFRIVALQKHDSQSTKCRLEVLLSNIKFFIIWLFVRICYSSCSFNLIFLAKDEHVDLIILYSVCWIVFYQHHVSHRLRRMEPQQLFCCPRFPMLLWGSNFHPDFWRWMLSHREGMERFFDVERDMVGQQTIYCVYSFFKLYSSLWSMFSLLIIII